MLYVDQIREYCLSKPETSEGLPFDQVTLVFKVAGKMFALIDIDLGESVNLKCEPEYAIRLREEHENEITGGYHMNKKYWNTVTVDGSVSAKQLQEWINHSYQQVVVGLPKIKQKELQVEGEK